MGNHWCFPCPLDSPTKGSRSASEQNFGHYDQYAVDQSTTSKLQDFRPILEAYKSSESATNQHYNNKDGSNRPTSFDNMAAVCSSTRSSPQTSSRLSQETQQQHVEQREREDSELEKIAKDFVNVNVFIASQIIYPALERFRKEQEEEQERQEQELIKREQEHIDEQFKNSNDAGVGQREDLHLDLVEERQPRRVITSCCSVIVHSPDAPPATTPMYDTPPPLAPVVEDRTSTDVNNVHLTSPVTSPTTSRDEMTFM